LHFEPPSLGDSAKTLSSENSSLAHNVRIQTILDVQYDESAQTDTNPNIQKLVKCVKNSRFAISKENTSELQVLIKNQIKTVNTNTLNKYFEQLKDQSEGDIQKALAHLDSVGMIELKQYVKTCSLIIISTPEGILLHQLITKSDVSVDTKKSL